MLPFNIHQNSADAIRDIMDLHFPVGSILDVNYGLGVFYKLMHHERNIVGIDIRPTGNIRADNRHLPFAANSFDTGVCDPPYRRGGHDTKYLQRYGQYPGTTKKANYQYFDLLPELLRICRNGLIIKAQDETDGHRFHHRMSVLVNFMHKLTGLAPHDVAYVVRRGVVDNNIKGQTRHFLANGLSYFLIYRWSQKNPFRPVRF